MFSADQVPPCDGPNLSKDYLAGTAPKDWIPLRQLGFYLEFYKDNDKDNDIEFRLGTPVAAIDPDRRQLRCADGTSCDFGALLLATGTEPVHLSLAGSDKGHVCYFLLSPQPCRQPSIDRGGGGRASRRHRRRQLHPARGRRLVAPARSRGACGCSGNRWSVPSASRSAALFAVCTCATALSSTSARRSAR
jgi:hypothetical protein